MTNFKKYIIEFSFVLVVILLSIAGFWSIYFGDGPKPTSHQTLHVITNLVWLCLLLYQLSLIGKKNISLHRKVGLTILFCGPFLFASVALLSVFSAHKGLVSGEGDILIVQNVMVTFELGFIILMAFVLKKRRKLHESFMLSTAVLFMGIALFFTLISFVPQFKIEGPETFYRFETAGVASRYICLFVGFLFFLKDRKNGWPILLTGSFFTLNDFINKFLTKQNLIQPLTEFVGSLNQIITFLGSFTFLLVLLTLTGIVNKRNMGTLR